MPIIADHQVEITGGKEIIDLIAEIGDSYRYDTKADSSHHIRNNFFTPFYSMNKDFELEQTKDLIQKLDNDTDGFTKDLVSNVTQLPHYQQEIVLAGIDRAKSQEYKDITASIKNVATEYIEQSNMYFDAKHSAQKNENFLGAKIPMIGDVDISDDIDDEKNSRILFSYPTAYAPSHDILNIMANAIMQRQSYEVGKNPNHKVEDVKFNCYSQTEDGFVSRTNILLKDLSITSETNEGYIIADAYGFTEDYKEFKNRVDEIVKESGYKNLEDSVMGDVFQAAQNQRNVVFTDYTHEPIDLPFNAVNLVPTEGTLMRHLKENKISDTYFNAMDLLIEEAEIQGDEGMKEYWFETKIKTKKIYDTISSSKDVSTTSKILSELNNAQSAFSSPANQHVFDRLIDYSIIKGVLQLRDGTQNSPEVISLIDKAIILYKKSSGGLSPDVEVVNADIIKALTLNKEIVASNVTDKKTNPQIKRNKNDQ